MDLGWESGVARIHPPGIDPATVPAGAYDVVLEKKLLNREQLDQLLNPKTMV